MKATQRTRGKKEKTMAKTTAKSTNATKTTTRKDTPDATKGAARKTSEKATESVPARARGAKAASAAQPATEPSPAPAAATTGAKGAVKPRAAKEPLPIARDPRLPEPGTVLEKRDRHGELRCQCTVEKDGIRYAGQLYSSISSAGLAAAKDLGLKNKTQNGFIFWGLSKPAAPARDLLVGVESAWKRYRDGVERLLAKGVTEENRDAVAVALRKHRDAFPDFG
jgi:hypothetical protein